jgi:hypothetical protein
MFQQTKGPEPGRECVLVREEDVVAHVRKAVLLPSALRETLHYEFTMHGPSQPKTIHLPVPTHIVYLCNKT